MKRNDLVSIIIPCYNQAQYLEESVNSALEQTYKNIEIIIINDGSTDNTEDIALDLQKIHPEKIRFISQKNTGVSEARNNAIKESKGQYILPLDADDLIDKNMISSCLKSMIENDTDIVYVDTQCFGIKNFLIRKLPFSQNNFLYQNLCNVTSLFKKEMWRKLGGYANNMKEGYEDWEFWIHALKKEYKFQLLSEPLLLYRTQELSRNTKATIKDVYLRAIITLNHPELYTIEQVKEAIQSIRETESLADLYFYSAQDLPINEEYLVKTIRDYLASNVLQEKQFIAISDTDKQVGLFALDKVKNRKYLKRIYKEKEADFVLFYAPLRYEVSPLKNLAFSWDKNGGIINTYGTIFPFIFKSKRENDKSQLIAYQRELKYIKYRSNMNNEAAKKKLDSLRHKYNIDTEISQKKLDTVTNNYNLIMKSISNLIKVPAKTKPLQKISAYKSLKKAYFELRRIENEKE